MKSGLLLLAAGILCVGVVYARFPAEHPVVKSEGIGTIAAMKLRVAARHRAFLRKELFVDYLPLTGGTLTGALYGTSAYFSGSLGIGETASSTALHVYRGDGSLARFSQDAGNYWYTGIDAGGTYLEAVGSVTNKQRIRLQTANSNGVYTQLFIDGPGETIFTGDNVRVGIGTYAPSEKFVVKGANIKPVIGGLLQHTTLYNGYDAQANTALEINTSAGVGNGTSVIALSNSAGTQSGLTLGGLNFALPATGAPEKRGAVIASHTTAESSGGITANLTFYTTHFGAIAERMRISSAGNVGIGTENPSEKLSVNGNIRARKVLVMQTGWSDYVFDHNYPLMPIAEVSSFIKKYKHLPDVPSAEQVEKNGISVGDTQALLLRKIEELTLYVIHLDTESRRQKEINKRILKELRQLKSLKRK